MGGLTPLQTMISKFQNKLFQEFISTWKLFQKLLCKTFDYNRPNKDVKLRLKSLSNCLDQISSINYQKLFGCAIKKIHQQHPQTGQSYIGKGKIYLTEALADRQCKFGSTFQVRFEHIIVQRENKISYDSFSNLKSY